MPYIDINAKSKINNIEHVQKDIYSEKKTFKNIKNKWLENSYSKRDHKINENIYIKLDINDIESTLIDYAIEVNRNLIVGDEAQKNQILSN